ncbi:receptor-like protein kinase 5 [Actinidia eriantha]|uniref:receptor-like protein kinase 5 n=1 Tax=Actinidia eriantha TaxID=165200 RepID=UPI0025898F6C|nr:receptor-like protein kinase 5 [Actinidia eriantha]
MSKIPHYFLPIILTLLMPLYVISQQSDQTTLLTVKQQLGNPPWSAEWSASSSPCDWPEIVCTAGNVTNLVLQNKNITGKFPQAICDLKSLTYLDLSFNFIPGGFPTVLYNCSNLQYLDLSQNWFVGPIPSDINRLSSSLQWIDVSANSFSGDIPPAIGNLPELRTLYLFQNRFSGTFPEEIGDLANLVNLGMAYNDKFLPAKVPSEFGKLTKLQFLWMADCNLIGEIPDSFSNLSSLEYLDLTYNKLQGPIPKGLFQLKNLSIVYLYRNQLSGEIPTPIESLGLTDFDLSMNNLIGPIPEDVGKLQKLKFFNFHTNQFSGTIPPSIGRIPTLVNFRVFTNKLNGTLPPELGLHSKLEAFEVSENEFTGTLPENLCAGKTLFGVVAFSNKLTGKVPESLGGCHSLRTIQLFNNNFSGEVPLGLYTLFNLSSLMLSNNTFLGGLPKRLAWNLTRLEISNNKFSGEIPKEVSSWVSLVVFKASNNQFSGPIPMEFTSLPQAITLFLDGNSLTGEFPTIIESWKSLSTLNLARNKLSGPIPAQFGSLPDLLNLDLSENKFSGQIPPELGLLRLTTLNLSYNELTGKIPHEFDNLAYEHSFLNNPSLCATNPISNLRKCLTKTRESKTLSPSSLAVILVLAVILFMVTVLLTFFVVRDYRRKKLKRKLAGWKLTSFQILKFTKADILSRMTENNLIGSGGSGKFYRIAVPNSEEFVAVKRIWNNRKLDHKLEKESLAEVEILGTIRHSNIVKLIGCISSEDSKLLVYEYMEYQSLDKWLHGKRRTEREPKCEADQQQLPNPLAQAFQEGELGKAFLTMTVSIAILALPNRESSPLLQKSSLCLISVAIALLICGYSIRRVFSKISNALEQLGTLSIIASFFMAIGSYLDYPYVMVPLVSFIACVIMSILSCIPLKKLYQSFDKWLHGKRTEKEPFLTSSGSIRPVVLDWRTRLQIAVGAAQGLCYMHHGCSPAIVHRNVKSSNILLDSEFKPKIADFGLANILAKRSEPNTMSAVAGSFGYTAPEYAYTTKVNEKIDVYSFGVVLLELVTGREANDGDEHTNLAEWAWRRQGEGISIIDALDEDIKEPLFLEEQTTVFRLGLMCTNPQLLSRPSMKEVLEVLRRCDPVEGCGGKKLGTEYDAAPLLGSANMSIQA